MLVFASIDYSVFPPINAALNALSGLLLIIGLILIRTGRARAHMRVMVSALITSAVFLACYLTYHYGTGHTEFPAEYPVARKVYLAILLPHIVLAVVNLPFIVGLVWMAFHGKFKRHKRIARLVFPSWMFVSVTGVIIYFMLYHWFTPTEGGTPAPTERNASAGAAVVEKERAMGDLVFTPGFQAVDAEAGQEEVEVEFEVANTGDRPIEITGLESDCACLSVSVDRHRLGPGENATVTGIFETAKLRGTSEKKIVVSTDQDVRPGVLVTRIRIAPIYTIEESMTSWKVGEEPTTKTVKFRVVRDEPIRVLGAESKREGVACELVVVEEGRAYDLELTPESTDASLLGIVRIETDCEIENYARPLAYFSIQ
ncbi:MAG: DUF420 domain-containing protein [Verrucomicrobiales bacterium]